MAEVSTLLLVGVVLSYCVYFPLYLRCIFSLEDDEKYAAQIE